VTLAEMDVDAVLARHPQLVLVDELAHTNAPGSRHPKRYQDVLDLLEAGIDVYSTLNIQHLESLNDVVAQITGVIVRETVPDRILDEAAELELVDLPPDELVQRLREGKVYVPDQAARAVHKFFRKGNLTALRELTMRRAAQRIDDQMQSYMQTRAIAGPWAATERLMVCASESGLGERLVRSARRLADELDAEWYVVYVETPENAHFTQEQQDRLARTLRLGEELGAKVHTLPATSVVPTIMEFARKHNVTKILAGKPVRPRWLEHLRGSVVDELIHVSGTIDVYVISGESTEPSKRMFESWLPHHPWQRYAGALGLVVGATGLSAIFAPFISPANLILFYLLAVVIAAVYLGRGPAMLASAVGVLAFDFTFVPPQFTFVVSDTEYLLTFAGLFIVGMVISQLAARVREQADAARAREAETAILYSLTRDLAVAPDLDSIMEAIVRNVNETFGRKVAILLPNGEGQGQLRAEATSSDFSLDDSELAVAVWAYEHKQPAGRGTDTLPAAQVRYLPLVTARGVIGVMGIGPGSGGVYLSPAQRRLLDAFASLAAVAIERAQLADAAQTNQLLEATEKLQTALLNSISHDLRTPLVSITGALTSLQEDGSALDETTRMSLVDNARQEAERLNRLVGNLLDMTRVESGALIIRREPAEIQDVIGAALEQLNGRLGEHPIQIDTPADLPLVPLDFGLMVQLLVNLVGNAVKYSPPDSPIEIRAVANKQALEVQVADRGVGVPPEDLDRIFDKFYRVQHPENVSGSGMGLSICKGIIEAHGGQIFAENRPGGGTLLRFTLPRLTLPLSKRVTRQVTEL
jgi:two-component system sensor histidine kinase KdpD